MDNYSSLDGAFHKKHNIELHFGKQKKMSAFKITAWLILCLSVGLALPRVTLGRHNCPEPPSVTPSLFSTIFQLPTVSTIASSIATGRTSNTSGCDRGHPSDSFYRPVGAIYLEHTLEYIVEESARGQGQHLEALARLAGCQTTGFALFSQTLQKNYEPLFAQHAYLTRDQRSDQIWHQVGALIVKDAQLRQICTLPF